MIGPYALLIGRIAVGVVFLVHGLQKFTGMGISGVTGFFDQLGIPLAGVAAPVVAVLEVAGGLALIVGAGLPIAGVLLALDMLGAIYFVHLSNGFAVDKGGYEFVLTLAAASLVIGFSGGGAFAADGLLRRKRESAASAA
ncbi:DoxX family protein [Nonomuraea sp. NBC_01738]|uniref:DoxX family protein n=1 Tax=Nonomuraea sp. NBC_01738 TaxID=2976003 RepID=UPI002E0E4DF9|nr:DoxX family protein [Nonomuraea sp. NBC_01738]